MSEFETVDLNYFIFSFPICCFILFYFNFWRLRVRDNVTLLSHSHMTRSQSHIHMSHKKYKILGE